MTEQLEYLKNYGEEILQDVIKFAPNLLGALSVLIVGYLIAVVVSIILKKALETLKFNDRLQKALDPEGGSPSQTTKSIDGPLWISRAVRYLIMLFVLVAFFDVMKLSIVTEPLNELLTQILAYIPRILGPAILLVVAWILASLIKALSHRVLTTINLDKRVGEKAGYSKSQSLSKSISITLYWLVFILFLPAILEGLALEGLLNPVKAMLEKTLAFIPNILAAGLIALIGFFAAKIVQGISSKLLESIGVNELSRRASIDNILGQYRLSELIGFFLYVVILIPVLIASLNALQLDAITNPASQMLASVLSAIPLLFAALILMSIAYLIGRILAGLLSNLASAAGFDNLFVTLGLSTKQASAEKKPSRVVYYVVFAGILIFAAIEALRLVHFVALAELLQQFLIFAGQILLGLIIFGVGLFLSDFVAKRVLSSVTKHTQTLAFVARASILILAGAMALRQMGLAEDIINLAFGISLGAVAVAAAIAFGLGAREVAGELAKDWVNRVKKGS
ncbi:MAG: hypothetical protein EA369_07515 [Bradymonadales bacterium]|nr:MAG: hypothetical protein EA369_07515 [Bradymonadales bacterium]